MRVKYFVRSVRPALPINRLLAAGVLLSKVNRGEKELSFFVPFKQSKQVDAILERSGAAYRKKGYSGMKAMLRKALSRPFLLVSVLIAITLVIVAENFVYGYTIVGNRLVNTFRVEDVLREQGAIGITYKGRIDTAALKKSIAAIEGVSFASVKVQGNRLLVEIKEELPREYPDEAVFSPVTSLYSAVVTRVVAESGSPAVKAGDRVAPGDLLISPTFTFTEGEAPSPARGEVWGVVTYQKEVLLPLTTVESVLTGEVFRARRVSLFGKTPGKERTPSFAEYDFSEREVYRGVGVIVREKVYYRRSAVTVYHDFDAEAPRLVSEARQALLLSVPFYAEERGGVVVEQKKLDNVLYIVLYYSVEQRIDSLFTAP